jgi:hypothetical protein
MFLRWNHSVSLSLSLFWYKLRLGKNAINIRLDIFYIGSSWNIPSLGSWLKCLVTDFWFLISQSFQKKEKKEKRNVTDRLENVRNVYAQDSSIYSGKSPSFFLLQNAPTEGKRVRLGMLRRCWIDLLSPFSITPAIVHFDDKTKTYLPSDFFPVILSFLRQMPVIGQFLSLPYIRGVSYFIFPV